jgi:hypothetical protein
MLSDAIGKWTSNLALALRENIPFLGFLINVMSHRALNPSGSLHWQCPHTVGRTAWE